MKESDKKKIGEAYLRLHSKENKQLKIYKEYSDVMLKMWIDKLVTDSEYNRIMNRLNDKFRIER